MFHDALWLAKQEFKYHWFAVFTTLVVGMLIGALTGGLLTNVGLRVNSVWMNQFMLDLIFIGMAPSFGALFMSKPYLSYKEAKENPYAKRMAVLRTLPISVSVLALSRTIFMLITLIIMSVAFYGAMAFMVFRFSANGNAITVNEFIIFILFWFGFMLALGGMNPYIEYGINGKMLHILPHFYVVLFILFEILLYFTLGSGVVEQVILLVKNIGWPVAFVSLLFGLICCYAWNQSLKSRLQKRDYV